MTDISKFCSDGTDILIFDEDDTIYTVEGMTVMIYENRKTRIYKVCETYGEAYSILHEKNKNAKQLVKNEDSVLFGTPMADD